MSENIGGGHLFAMVRNIFPLFANKKRANLVSPRETRICTKRSKQNIARKGGGERGRGRGREKEREEKNREGGKREDLKRRKWSREE